jgi:hypothetical protein
MIYFNSIWLILILKKDLSSNTLFSTSSFDTSSTSAIGHQNRLVYGKKSASSFESDVKSKT